MAEGNENKFLGAFKDWKGFIGVMTIIVIFVLITTAFLAPIVTKSGIEDKSLIIAFIGVLATFVVIGNFAQVSEIRHNVEQDLAQKTMDISKAQTAADNLKKDLDTHIANIVKVDKRIDKLEKYTDKHIDDLESTICEQSDIDKLYAQNEVNNVLKYLDTYKCLVLNQIITIYGETNNVLSLLEKLYKRSEQEEYSIRSSTGEEIKASSKIFEDRIEFYKEGKLIDPGIIESVEGIQLRIRALFTLYKLYYDFMNPSVKIELSNTVFTNSNKEDEKNGNIFIDERV